MIYCQPDILSHFSRPHSIGELKSVLGFFIYQKGDWRKYDDYRVAYFDSGQDYAYYYRINVSKID